MQLQTLMITCDITDCGTMAVEGGAKRGGGILACQDIFLVVKFAFENTKFGSGSAHFIFSEGECRGKVEF